MSELNRRDLLVGGGAAALALAGISSDNATDTAPSRTTIRISGRTINVVDLTHRLTSDFNVTPGRPRIAMDPIVGSGYDAGMNLNRLLLIEHTGTHIDAPRHFDNGGRSLGEIPIGDLVVPLAVIDIRGAVAADPDAALMAEDVLRWERKWGRLPAGCCVAVQTGFDLTAARSKTAAPATMVGGALRMPGFSPEVCEMLIAERDVKGIALDLGSLDRGSNVPSYPVHRRWLRSGRWGLEMLTNLDAVPPSGAILIVGAAPIKDATGIPIRAIALF